MTPINDEASISVTKHRVDALELRLDKHIEAVTTRLDKLLELTATLATISERQVRNQSDIDDIRSRINHEEIINRDSIVRLHSRIDTQKDVIDNNAKDFHKWLNRGWGAWAVAVILFSVIQYMVQSSISEYQRFTNDVQASIRKQDIRLSEIENMITTLLSRK